MEDIIFENGSFEGNTFEGQQNTSMYRGYRRLPQENFFRDTDTERFVRLVVREGGPGNLLLDGRLPDGSRVNATIPPVSPNGPTMTIRKQMSDPLTVVDLMKFGTIPPRLASLFWMFGDGMGAAPCNILVAGGTGSGKTTTLNVISSFIPSKDRLITIEDVAEVQLIHEHHVQLETFNSTKPEADS